MTSSFHRLRDAGLSPLLPIIPAGSQISASSKTLQGRFDMLGKIPGLRRHDGWVGMANWDSWDTKDSDLDDWAEMGAGVGLRCENVVAVDIDVTEKPLADLVQMDVMTHLGFGPTRTGNAPKRLVVFRIAPGALPTKKVLRFTDWNGTAHVVELLGARQQFVVEGVHPKTGRPYTWDDELADVGLDGLTEVTVEELDAFLGHVAETLSLFDCEMLPVTHGSAREAGDPDALRTDDMGLLRSAVGAIPNDEDTDREFQVKMAHAIHAAAIADPATGFEIFEEWADRWTGAQREGEVAHIWGSVQHSSIGIQWLLDRAREHGFDSAADDFGAEVSDAPEPGEAGSDNNGSWWASWVYVNRLKRFVNLDNGQQLDKEQFNDRFRAVGGDKEKAADVFLEHRPAQCWADDVDYRPGCSEHVYRHPQRHEQVLNMWRPGPGQSGEWAGLDSSERAVRMWLQLAEHLFPKAEERGHLFDWMAHLIQKPGVKPNWHPLIGGHVHGTGKDSLFIPLTRALGDNHTVIRTDDLEDQWTWWAENTQLVVVSEINSFERRAVMNRLKSYMADPPNTIKINKKGQPQYSVPNLFAMVMFTNNEDAVALERSDRRFFVLWTDAEPLAEDWYTEYHDLFTYSDVGAASVWRWLAQRDISGFKAKGNAPFTSAKETMRRAALPAHEGLIMEAIENGEGPFAADLVAATEVRDWLKTKVARPPAPDKLGIALRQAGGVRLGRVRLDAGTRDNLWVVRRQAMYEQMAVDKGLAALKDRMVEQRESLSGAEADFGT